MSDVAKQRDLSQRPMSFMLGWGVPILIFFSMNFARGIIPGAAIIVILAAAFAWMGVGCLINARRCGRRHCYLSGPVFFAGAIGVLLQGFQAIDLGPDGLLIVIWGAWLLAGLTFVPEWIWGRYVRTSRPS